MSNIITPCEFQSIAWSYGYVKSSLDDIADYLYDAVLTIAYMDDIVPTEDLIDVFYNSFENNKIVYRSNESILQVVRKLHTHVINRGGYKNINSYLTDANITVPQAWADLSAEAGQIIDPSHISNTQDCNSQGWGNVPFGHFTWGH